MGNSLNTKKRLAGSLRDLLGTVPMNRITIEMIASNCGYNRQTFYYHFRDVRALVEWMFVYEIRQAAGDIRKYSTSAAIELIMRYLYDNRSVTLAVFGSLERDYVERFIYSAVHDAVYDNVIRKSVYVNIDPKDMEFIANCFTLVCTALLIQWMDGGMREEINGLIRRTAHMMQGAVDMAVQRMKQE